MNNNQFPSLSDSERSIQQTFAQFQPHQRKMWGKPDSLKKEEISVPEFQLQNLLFESQDQEVSTPKLESTNNTVQQPITEIPQITSPVQQIYTPLFEQNSEFKYQSPPSQPLNSTQIRSPQVQYSPDPDELFSFAPVITTRKIPQFGSEPQFKKTPSPSPQRLLSQQTPISPVIIESKVKSKYDYICKQPQPKHIVLDFRSKQTLQIQMSLRDLIK